MEKTDENQRMKRQLTGFSQKPRLLLHVCCAPCSTACLERLAPHARVTVLFYNPNLDTREEFKRRAGELRRLVLETGLAEDCVILPHDPEAYAPIAPGRARSPEGGSACRACFQLRLQKTAEYAKAHGFDLFTTTLTVSPHKNAAMLNKEGEEAGQAVGVAFLHSDFKKEDGYRRSVQLSQRHRLYRQDYCGCAQSKKEAEERRKKRETTF